MSVVQKFHTLKINYIKMGILYNYIYLLSLPFLAGFINPSWAAEQYKENNEKQVDQRISDIIGDVVLHFGHSVGLELASTDSYAARSEIFSPLSLMAALSLLTLGAKGKSYQELKQILGLDSDSELIHNPNKFHEQFGLMLSDLQNANVNSDGINKRPNANWRFTPIRQAPVVSSGRVKVLPDHLIKVANGLFVQNSYSINPDYSQVLQSIYKTEFAKLDFEHKSTESQHYINAWVNKATLGKIPEIIKDEIDKSTKVILASTLYFRAFWDIPFLSEAVSMSDFYIDGRSYPPIKVQMMPVIGIYPFYDAKEYDCRIIGLPYKGNETTMYVIQPNQSSRQKLRDLQYDIDAQKINRMIDNMERRTALLTLPKMHFTRTLHMKKILKKMNVEDVFRNGYSDLSLIGQRQQANHEDSSTETRNPTQFANKRVGTQSVPVTFESIYRERPVFKSPPVSFSSRFGEDDDSFNTPKSVLINNTTTEKSVANSDSQLNKREKRDVLNSSPDTVSLSLSNLESDRQKVHSSKSDLYVDDILHNVNFSVDEHGTEAAAATLTYIQRSGTDVIFHGDAPFLIIIRHDPTKLPLFYGIINKPEL